MSSYSVLVPSLLLVQHSGIVCSKDSPSDDTTYNPVDGFSTEAAVVWLRLQRHKVGRSARLNHRRHWHHCLLCWQQRFTPGLPRRNPVSPSRLCHSKLEWRGYDMPIHTRFNGNCPGERVWADCPINFVLLLVFKLCVQNFSYPPCRHPLPPVSLISRSLYHHISTTFDPVHIIFAFKPSESAFPSHQTCSNSSLSCVCFFLVECTHSDIHLIVLNSAPCRFTSCCTSLAQYCCGTAAVNISVYCT